MLQSPGIVNGLAHLMRLLYVLPEFPPDFGGGISTLYSKLLPSLVQSGHSVTVLLAGQDYLDKPSYTWRGVEVLCLQSEKLTSGLQAMEAWSHHAFLHHFLPTAWASWMQAQDLGPFDLVETTDWALLFIPWLVQARRQPVLVSLHGSCGQLDWHENPDCRSGEGQLVRILESAILPLADCLIANSNLNAEFWWQQCGVLPQVIPPIAEAQSESGLNIAASNPNWSERRSNRGVVVGRLQNLKGPEVLCKALRLLPGQQINWIGHELDWEGSNIGTAAYLRRNFPDVVDHQLHLFGKVPPDQVKSLIRQAAFLCVPSLFDVFNITVLEAIAVHTPVICSLQAGAVMLIHHNKNGFVFDPAEPKQLALAIRDFLELSSLERDDLCRSALAQARDVCGESHIVRLFIDLYAHSVQDFKPRGGNVWLECMMLKGWITSSHKITSSCRRKSIDLYRYLLKLICPLVYRVLFISRKFYPR